MVEVSSSILNMIDEKDKETLMALEKAGTDLIHIDVMDGKFVEKNNYDKIKNNAYLASTLTQTPLDVHLMVDDVENAIYDFSSVNPNIITFQIEACKDKNEVKKMIDLIKNENSKVGLAIKPETDISTIYEFLPYIHEVLVMTVEPGKGGQTLLNDMIDKVINLKKYIDDNNYEVDIAVDGGINLVTAPKLKEAGANILVAGSAILLAKDYKVIIDELKM